MEKDIVKRAKLAEERKKTLRKNITRAENNILKLLVDAGIEFIFQEAFFDEYYFLIADFYLPKYNLCIEVDGFSHNSEKKRKQERKRAAWLRKKGIGVLRIRNKATYQMTTDMLLKRISRANRRIKKYKTARGKKRLVFH